MPTRLFYPFVVLLITCLVSSGNTQGNDVAVRSGPMVGYGEMTEVMLWVQLSGHGQIQYRFWPQGDRTQARLTQAQEVSSATEYIAHTLISGLAEGRRFDFELLVNGKAIRSAHPLRFQTQQLWQWRKDPPSFTVAIGSCAYVNDPSDDRPGTPYGSDYEIFTAIAQKNPDLMIWLGDNAYYREIDYTSVDRMKYRMTHTRSLPELQRLLGATHNYAIWDDHDFGPDNSDRTFALREHALEIFKLFWANHSYGTLETPGVFGSFLWGDVEFFLLDDRFHRSPNHMPIDSTKVMFGDGQFQWLKESLARSSAPFKMIVNGNQLLAPETKHEALCIFPREYNQLLHWIKSQNIPGVVCISGDIHSTQLVTLRDSSFYPLVDVTCSALTAGIYKPSDLRLPAYYDSAKSVYEHNFIVLKYDGPRKDRRLTVECFDKNGKSLWIHTLLARELVSNRIIR